MVTRLLMALVAYEHQVVDAVEQRLGDTDMSARSFGAEGVDMSLLRDVDALLSHRRLPQRLVASGELATTRRPSPEHVLHSATDAPGRHALSS